MVGSDAARVDNEASKNDFGMHFRRCMLALSYLHLFQLHYVQDKYLDKLKVASEGALSE